MDYHGAVARYYRAFRERDREALQALLTPDFHFVSSFGEYHERDSMLEAIWPAVGQSWAVDIRIFGYAPEFMVRYQIESSAEANRRPTAMAEYVRFEGDTIAEIEVYVGRELGGRAGS